MKNKLITKDDLKNLATKSDLKKFATKKRAKGVEKNLRVEILKVEERVENIEEGQKRILEQMKEQHDEVMTAVSNFDGRVEVLEEENSVGAKHTRVLREEVDSHEKRISKLEASI